MRLSPDRFKTGFGSHYINFERPTIMPDSCYETRFSDFSFSSAPRKPLIFVTKLQNSPLGALCALRGAKSIFERPTITPCFRYKTLQSAHWLLIAGCGLRFSRPIISNMGNPPALPGRHAKFDSDGKMKNLEDVNRSKFKVQEVLHERHTKFSPHALGM